ncbi:MAG: DUF503 domain-containing protein [Anaerolineae bacterium]
MVVGLATLTLVVPDATSLKDKRRVVRSVTSRLRARHNVAVAEVGSQGTRQTIALGLACVSNDAGHAHAVLEKAVHFVGRQRIDAELADYSIEML